ncbi:MAG: phosphotransferase family protein [Bacteroidota bacterium]
MPELSHDQAVPIRKGEELDVKKLEGYLQEKLGSTGALEIQQFPGGYSNLTYLLKMGDREMVLRRPPFGANIKSGHDMSREYKILSKLNGHYDKVPEALAFDEAGELLGAPFYVMERVKGVIIRPKMPKEVAPDEAQMKQISTALVNTFVELHNVDYHAAGLEDLGRPAGYNERQITGWIKRYNNAQTDEIPEMEKTASWLMKNIPAESKHALIHNDFKYDNMILDPHDLGKVKAILDWEMATLGDPLMDLVTSIVYCVNPDYPDFMKQLQLSPTTLPGNPSRGEFVNLYAEKSGLEVGDFVFYFVYGLFKIAVIVQQIYYRYKKGHTQDERFASLGMAVKGCGMVAQQAIQRKKIDNLF